MSGRVALDKVFRLHTSPLGCKLGEAVSLDGRVVEALAESMDRLIVQEELRPKEFRLLREFPGTTPSELAYRLGVTRVTVNRRETAEGDVGHVHSLALRTVVAWKLDDPALARDLGGPSHPLGVVSNASK